MNADFLVRVAVVLAVAVSWSGASWEARAGSTSYDIKMLLDEPHPFAHGVSSSANPDIRLGENQLRAPARVPAASAGAFPGRSAVAPTAGDLRPQVATVPGQLPQQAQSGRAGPPGIISELRVGVLAHDRGPFTRNEEGGIDTNLEVLFTSPDFLRIIWSPRPHLGGNINSAGDTSQVYFGLSWEWDIWGSWFAGFSFGGAVHDSELTTTAVDQKELGCRLLFRESIEAGYRFVGRHSVSIYLDHISNAGLCDKNEGLENFGVRYGYRF